MLKRHLIGGSKTDTSMSYSLFSSKNIHRRRDASSLFVEVCTGGCQQNGCLNSALPIRLNYWFSNFFSFLLINFFLFLLSCFLSTII